MCTFSPFYPVNHFVAAELALAISDVYSLTDAVEGCWLAGLTPPALPPDALNPTVATAISTLVVNLQRQLQNAIANKDVGKLEAGIEMLQYLRRHRSHIRCALRRTLYNSNFREKRERAVLVGYDNVGERTGGRGSSVPHRWGEDVGG